MYNVVLLTKLLFFTEIFLSEILMIFDIEIILKVQFWHFLTRPSSKDLQKNYLSSGYL